MTCPVEHGLTNGSQQHEGQHFWGLQQSKGRESGAATQPPGAFARRGLGVRFSSSPRARGPGRFYICQAAAEEFSAQ
jgi:hypothetical protein